MPRHLPPKTPKGGWPGAGRPKGKPNPATVEVRLLVTQMLNDPDYQQRLRLDFRRRKVHPTIEGLIWAYGIGKPTQPINLAGSVSVDVGGRLEEERRIFAQLDIAELEQLAAESQRLVDRATALVRLRDGAPLGLAGSLTPQDIDGEVVSPNEDAKTLGKQAGSDTEDYVNQIQPINDDDNPL